MEKGKSSDCKDCSGKYVLITDEEDPRLALFEKPLPCYGCGIGWSLYYNKDPRERIGLAASAIAALVCTIIILITLAVIFL
ncbi:hypothetical protein MUK42_03960 [Musa troglodytarum]|uniref:Uncharacterized protein n=1 Tax=Musa troglodytarum TaxID=320322 RepID=A0A9E7G900_9LILI|nr:hypothetical protein MUK42_03960 [Musa troglodytarum]